jgi:hypothetical protein
MTFRGYALLLACLALGLVGVARAASGNIDPNHKWAWGTNVGGINFDPAYGGVRVYHDHLEGYAWGENIGWIHFQGTAADMTEYKVVALLYRIYLPLVVRYGP